MPRSSRITSLETSFLREAYAIELIDTRTICDYLIKSAAESRYWLDRSSLPFCMEEIASSEHLLEWQMITDNKQSFDGEKKKT